MCIKKYSLIPTVDRTDEQWVNRGCYSVGLLRLRRDAVVPRGYDPHQLELSTIYQRVHTVSSLSRDVCQGIYTVIIVVLIFTSPIIFLCLLPLSTTVFMANRRVPYGKLGFPLIRTYTET